MECIRLPEYEGDDPATSNVEGSWKCNLFVGETATNAGAPVPKMNKSTLRGYLYYPSANQWCGTTSTLKERLTGTNIANWDLQSAGAYPQPGWVAAKPGSSSGHVGILDYDGLAIAAGGQSVHKRAAHGLNGGSSRTRRFSGGAP